MEGPEGNLEDVFEIDRVRQLVELMKEHDLSEIDLRQTHQRIRLRRGAEGPPAPELARIPPTGSYGSRKPR